jgi:hypothetical protein
MSGNLRKTIERAAIERDYGSAVAQTKDALGVVKETRAVLVLHHMDQEDWFRLPVPLRRRLLGDYAATEIRYQLD